MIITRSAFLIVLIFICGVTCGDDNSKYLKNVRRIKRGVYNFNHPPSYHYEPIPVAVVYDETNTSEGKTLKKIVDEKENILGDNNPEDKVTTTVEDVEVSSTVSTDTEIVTEISTPNVKHSKGELKPKSRTFHDYQIPVAVVYETETHRLRSNEEVPVTLKPKSRRQGPQRVTSNRKKEETVSDENNNTVTKTLEPHIKTQNENIKQFMEGVENTTKFPKRLEGPEPIVPILESESYVFAHNGNFHYSYEGGDGTKAFERGKLKTFDDDSKGAAVVGSYSYTDKDGNDFSLSYTADENGYKPVGAHLPTPPPIPPAIARALKHLATKKPDLDSEPVTKSYW